MNSNGQLDIGSSYKKSAESGKLQKPYINTGYSQNKKNQRATSDYYI